MTPKSLGLFCCLFVFLIALAPRSGHAATLQIFYEYLVENQVESKGFWSFLKPQKPEIVQQLRKKKLQSFSLDDLSKKKRLTISEEEGPSKKIIQFHGFSLSQVVSEPVEKLSIEERAKIDLVILRAKGGHEVLMPRAFLVKYPNILLVSSGQPEAGLKVILPKKTSPQILKEGILLDPLSLEDLETVTLSSYSNHFAKLFLSKRTDPAAMRGEKLFMRNCVICHREGVQEGVISSQLKSHPDVGYSQSLDQFFDSRQKRSLESYIHSL